MSNSQSSETEENKIKTREAPWIHPEAVADLIRSGEAEDRDRPALIRLYIRAQMNIFAIPGKSGKGKNYWPDNQTIADSLGVSISDIQNALRNSDIERIDGGKGRGENKRFRIVKKGRNHGGKKGKSEKDKHKRDKSKKGMSKKGKGKKGRRGKRKTSDQRGRCDSENVESTSATRNIDVCQQSNLRLQHVESTSATGGEGDGLEIKGVEGEGGGSLRACAREPKDPPPLVPQVSIKKVTAEEAMGFLKPYALLAPKDLSQGYYDVIAKVSGCYHRTADDLDVTSAELFLKDFPSDFKRPEILANWIYWQAYQLPAKWNKKTHFFTKFEDTWGSFRPQAETILKDLKSIDEERRKVELLQQEEREEAERIRQEAEDALQTAEEEKLRREEQARQQTLHDAFVASLPAEDSIIPAVMAVPNPATLRRKDYVAWLDAMLKATGLMLVMKPDDNDWGYIRNAYRAAGLDPRKFISLTRDFIVAKAGIFIGRLKENIKIHKPIRCILTWDSYPDYFGVEMFHPEACAFDIPKHLLDYQTPGPPIEAKESMLAARADQEEFDMRLED